MKETRLAAVMFTDIAGFSEMMEQDEKRTIDLLDEHNRIILPLIENFSGNLIDSIGDGLLITFDSVFSAVSCGLNIQNALAARNLKLDDELRLNLRIGIHLGDIWVEGDRIYGNGVNIASRIQHLARPGGICISEDVYYQVKNKDVIHVEEIPSPQLKNISRELRVFHLITGSERGEAGSLPAAAMDDRAPDLLGGKAVPVNPRATRAAAGDMGQRISESLETSLEDRIGQFVEGALDMALGAWEKTPAEKKDKLLGEIRKEDWYVDLADEDDDSPLARRIKGKIRDSIGNQIAESGESKSIVVKKSRDGDKTVTIAAPGAINIDSGKKKDDPSEHLGTVIFGSLSTIGFGIGVYFNGSGWFWTAFFLLGLLPLLMGTKDYIQALRKKARRKTRRLEEIEKRTLDCARENGGRLTVVQLAHCTGFSMEESQKELDRLSARNWVQQDISSEGVIYYEFPALLPAGSGEGDDPSR
jgi:class 3 adenylate cyclase